MANTTFSGSVRSKTGFKVINEASSTGAVTETGFSVNSTGQLVALGTHKFQSFAGTLASTDAATTAYGDGDVLVELGTLNTDAPDDLVTPSKFFIHRALIGITTAAGQTLVGGLSLSATPNNITDYVLYSVNTDKKEILLEANNIIKNFLSGRAIKRSFGVKDNRYIPPHQYLAAKKFIENNEN